MKYRLYTTSQKAWDGMFRAIAAAKESVYLEMYILLGDTRKTHDFLGILKKKARAGLEVVVIADALGSSELPAKIVQDLRDSGIEFIYFSHWFRRTHRKLLIIDKKIVFIGGVNIEEKIRDWRDIQIRLSGSVVKPFLKSFAYAYSMVGGKKESVLAYSRLPMSQKIKSWVTDNFPSTNKIYYLNHYYQRKIVEAVSLIQIITPYLLPPRRLIALLDDACRRGVRVEIMIPENTGIKPLNKVNYLNACRLSALGVKVYVIPGMNHAKVLLIDSEEGLIGSQNMDILSFNFNVEVGVFFRQKALVRDLSVIIDKWKGESREFMDAVDKIKIWDRILITILKIFYPIL